MSSMLDHLRTPMAAPETPGLRTMRAFIIASCILITGLVLLVQLAGFEGIRSWLLTTGAPPRLAGDAIASLKGAIAGLILAVGGLAPVYAAKKNRADDAHFLTLVGRRGEA